MDSIQELVSPQSLEGLLAYPVLTGPDARLAWPRLCQPFRKVVVLADERVWELHGDSMPGLEDLPHMLLTGGEAAKEWKQLEATLEFLVASECSRDSLLVTLGGGSLSDLGGLAASLFKRGMAVGHIPTTLLAQVDASVGGKTAINLKAGKNLAGTFHTPKFVLADPSFLTTLPQAEWRSGLGEVVKTALLGRTSVWQKLQAQAGQLADPQSVDSSSLGELIAACIVTKAQWVQPDPNEKHARKALNLGHTFGHAIEHAAGFGKIPHGVAVALGLLLALEASRRTKRLCRPGLGEEVRALYAQLGLPTHWQACAPHRAKPLTVNALQAGMGHDKKGEVGEPRFVLPLDLGRVEWSVPLEPSLITALFEDVLLSAT